MARKPKKQSKVVATLPRLCNNSAATLPQLCYKSVPLLKDLRGYLKKDVATLPQLWMPIETNLIFRYEFATLPPQTRYIFVAILLFCGNRGVDEIPMDTVFLASALNVDARMLKKSLEELENCGLLLERKKEREEKNRQTDRQKESANARVSVSNLNSFSESRPEQEKTKDESSLLNGDSLTKAFKQQSKFSVEECLKYVQLCKTDGDQIQNANALAMKLFKTGQADALIFNKLFPKEAELAAAESYGAPIKFTDEPCAVCFGAKMANVDGKGNRRCVHCKDERGKSTGKNPEGVNNEKQ